MLVAATWFLARLGWDLARPQWRTRPELARRRFAAITATGVVVAAAGFGGMVASVYGTVPGLVAAACLVPVYVFMAVVLRMLLTSFADGWSEHDGSSSHDGGSSA